MSSNIDCIFYINLEERKDRKEEIERELESFNLVKYERIDAVKTEPGVIGCAMSHLKAIRLAKERGYKNILILEDDFKFTVSKERFEENLTNFFKSEIYYHICFLSYKSEIDMEVKGFPFLRRTFCSQSASGYLVNENAFDHLNALFNVSASLLINIGVPWFFAVDQIWKLLQLQGYCYLFTERMGKQRESYSDLAGKIVDYGF